ncbi:acyltransferase [Maribacter arcticus]|uniref:Surface polysaccharide O-acyltransferase, integral membrane enzyme n=1 Tax=Maribacter arcticus TaxID=561365 RepID=A0A1T5BH62_9FLAO|nr:acyltransferase [Maribacter arcticus]SKB46359.1 Surface polysaccharide O-acyltransferase, integral membrane enzyme [Maribacter arcticus]
MMKNIQETAIEIDDLNLLRAIAILLVVLRHCFAPFMSSWPVSTFYEYNIYADITGKYISTISMPLFVFISGFLFSYLRNNLKKYPTYTILLSKKTARLLRPYFVLAPLYIVVFIDINTTFDFLKQFWMGAGHLWFLLMIFTIFMLFYPLESYFKKNPLKSFVAVVLLFCLYPGFSVLELYPISKAFQYLPFFFTGYFFHYNSIIISKLLKGKFWILFFLHSLLFIGSLFIPEFIQNGILKTLFRAFINLPLGLMSVSMLFLFFTIAKKRTTSNESPIIENINITSYYIYIIHQPLLLWLFQLKFLQALPPLYVILLVFPSVILSSLILGNVLLKFHWGRRLIGAS